VLRSALLRLGAIFMRSWYAHYLPFFVCAIESGALNENRAAAPDSNKTASAFLMVLVLAEKNGSWFCRTRGINRFPVIYAVRLARL
jgi:hypothetical protein